MGQQSHRFEAEITKVYSLDYLIYLPTDYRDDGENTWPLILFLHGAGERGDDIELTKKHGVPKVVDQKDDFPFIALSPQCPVDTMWSEHFDVLDTLLNEIVNSYAVDTGRQYLTGLSMGGHGTWHFASLYPQRFAAIAPICGFGPELLGFPERVRVLKVVPVWAFHGAKDDVVHPQETQKLVDELYAVGGNVKFTLYPDADHDSWTETYNNPALYDWFLNHSL